MIAAGILTTDDRCILLDGVLVAKMTKEPPHVTCVKLTRHALGQVVPPGWHVDKEDPIALPDGPGGFDSVPEPDVQVLRGSIRDYSARHPLPEDAPLVVEVSDSSLRSDRNKLVRYAWCGVPIVWIINLAARVVEVYGRPSGPADEPGYRDFQTFGENDEIPIFLDGDEVGRVAVRDLLP